MKSPTPLCLAVGLNAFLGAACIACSVILLYTYRFPQIIVATLVVFMLCAISAIAVVALEIRRRRRTQTPQSLASSPELSGKSPRAIILERMKTANFYVVIGLGAIAIVNLVLFSVALFAIMDDVIYPNTALRFARIGAVSNSSVSVWLRCPTGESRATLQWKTTMESSFRSSIDVSILADEDYTAVATLSNLTAATQYNLRWLVEGKVAFDLNTTTFPSPGFGDSTVTFGYGACAQRGFPYRAEVGGYWKMAQIAPRFLIHLGDFIYSDVPIHWGYSRAAYDRKYRYMLADPGTRALFLNAATPLFSIYDDHEFINDFEGPLVPPYKDAYLSWMSYMGKANPVTFPPFEDAASPVSYYTFSYGSLLDFFVLDNHVYVTNGSVLGAQQKARFKAWLAAPGARWKVVMTSFTWAYAVNKGGLAVEAPQEREELLGYMQNMTSNIVILSGDQHRATIVRLRPNLYELGASGFHVPPTASKTNPALSKDFGEDLLYESKGFTRVAAVTANFTHFVWDLYDERLASAPMFSFSISSR